MTMPDPDTELALLEDADVRARHWLAGVGTRPVFPEEQSIAALRALEEPLSESGYPDSDTIRLLDEVGGNATVASNGPQYFGFVLGATLPVAAAADRIALAWDQSAASFDTSPAAHLLEKQAGRLVLDALQLPPDAAIGFSTGASAATMTALAAARRAILLRLGWDSDRLGMNAAPEVRIVAPDLVHGTVLKAARILGFGLDNVEQAPTDRYGRIRPESLPRLDERTILILQAGELNTGEFDPLEEIIPEARAAGAWTHVDGAFGLWARASRTHAPLARGAELADSWATDAHKWLNTPYDAAMHIVRDSVDLSDAMKSDAAYAPAAPDVQRNLTLEFSRRARGIPVWAALRTLGRDGVEGLVDKSVVLAQRTAEGLREAGFDVLNRVVLNQVLVRAATPERTVAIRDAAIRSGETWFSPAVWGGLPAFRISVSSWRTEARHVDALVDLLGGLNR
jgi:glutamate/tyrosine decarboxylase-like PLP-dependent enzyme